MRLDVEGKHAIQDPNDADITRALAVLRSSGPNSFAILSSGDGSYIQAAGGSQTCVIEVRDVSTGRHYRAHQSQPHPVFPDGTKLAFGAGDLVLQSDEWFTVAQATMAFIEFRSGVLLPTLAPGWRDVTGLVFGSH